MEMRSYPFVPGPATRTSLFARGTKDFVKDINCFPTHKNTSKGGHGCAKRCFYSPPGVGG